MRSRTPLSVAGAILLPALLAACQGDRPDPDPATVQVQQQPPATQPAAGAPQQAPQLTAGPLPPGVTQDMVEQGRQIFHGQGICFTCHGQDAQGTQLAPSLTDGEWLWITPDGDRYQQMLTLIRNGVPNPRQYPAPMLPMGGVNLNEDQLRATTAYVYSLNPAAGP
jgi:mono/diheme cytochrome c family protein